MARHKNDSLIVGVITNNPLIASYNKTNRNSCP